MSNEVIICPDVGLKFIFKPKIDLKGGPGRGLLVNNNCSRVTTVIFTMSSRSLSRDERKPVSPRHNSVKFYYSLRHEDYVLFLLNFDPWTTKYNL